MKKTILKSALSLFSVAILFSSCLGDNESSIERNRDFAVIKTNSSGTKYAATAIQYDITSAGMQELTSGYAYYLSYKITDFIPNSAGLFDAELKDRILIERSLFNYGTPLPEATASRDSVYATNFGIGAFSPDEYFDDRWLFGYTSSVKEEEIIKATLFYDRAKQQEKDVQIEMSGAERENKMIIDIHFTKENPNYTPEAPTTTLSNEFFVDMSRIRNDFAPNPLIKEDVVTYNGTEYVRVKIKFRFWRITGAKKEQVYLGTWVIKEGNANNYYLLLKK